MVAPGTLLKGEVMNNNDPLGLGRVQVRVESLYDFLTPASYPWAIIPSRGGGSFDTGSVDRYEVGASVIVGFFGSNEMMPIVLGGIPKKTSDLQKYGEVPIIGITDKENSYDADWAPTDGLRPTSGEVDTPAEAISKRKLHVLAKTPKGTTILISDTSGDEYLQIIDRSGQVFEMVCPVLETENEHNASQRGLSNVNDDTQLGYEKMKGPAYIHLKDLSGNEVTLYSEEDEEKITLNNKAHSNSFTMDKEGVFIKALGGKSEGGVDIEITDAGVKVNGQYLVTESFVNWMNTNKSQIGISTKPGSSVPIHPSALPKFLEEMSDSMNSDGFKTQL